jgi:hypothetical protein
VEQSLGVRVPSSAHFKLSPSGGEWITYVKSDALREPWTFTTARREYLEHLRIHRRREPYVREVEIFMRLAIARFGETSCLDITTDDLREFMRERKPLIWKPRACLAANPSPRRACADRPEGGCCACA